MKNIILILFLIPIMACAQQNKSINQIDVDGLASLKEDKNTEIIVLDVRTEAEYEQGHIKNSLNLDVLQEDSFKADIKALDKTKTYYVICRSGSRSMKASNIMVNQGFNKVVNVKGGMNAWNALKH